MKEILTIIRAVIDIALTKGTDVARSLAFMRRPNFDATRGDVYLRALWRLILVCLVIPLPLIMFGFIGGAFGKIAVPIAVVLWSIVTIALALAASPLGLLVDALRGGVAGAGERYVRFVGNILFIEYSIAFLVTMIPLRNNPGGAPLLLVTLILLVLAGVFTKQWIVKMAITALPLLLLSFFSPRIFQAVNTLVASLEERTASTIENVGGEARILSDTPTKIGTITTRPQLKPGDTVEVAIGTEWTEVRFRDYNIPDRSLVNFYPQEGEILYLQFRSITYRSKERNGKWERHEPDGSWLYVSRIPSLAADPVYFQVDRPTNVRPNDQSTMTVKIF